MRAANNILCLAVLGLSAATTVAQSTSFADWDLARTLSLKGTTNHVQGIDFDNHTLWVTSVDSENHKGFLREFSLDSGRMQRSIEIQHNERFHPGGIASDATSLWIPVAEYRPNSTSVIERRNKRTLKLEFEFRVADHIGCIAVTPHYLIGGNWDSREFYMWDRNGNLIRRVRSDIQNAYQDMKFDPPFIVASGLLSDRTGAIDWLEFPAMRLSRRVHVGNTDRHAPFTREGMAIRGDELLLLPEDDPSRLFLFRRKP